MKENGKKYPKLEWAITLAGLIILIALVGYYLTHFTDILSQEDKTMIDNQKSYLKLYEGPKTLRSATEEDLATTAENMRDFSLLKSSDTMVSVNGYDCFVYETNVNHTRSWVSNYLPPISRTPITYFDFEGEVIIEVTVPKQNLDSVKISPVAYNIEPVIDQENKTVRFKISEPDAYTLIFDGSPTRALHIFANPKESDLPNFDDEDVVYIGPGEWDIETIDLKSGQTLYIDGGAVIHGVVQGNYVQDVTVRGRGIIDGSWFDGWKGKIAYVPLKFDNSDQVTIKDVIVLNANAWVCQAYQSRNGVINGLKIISPRPNGDGISLQSCMNYEVSNVFVRSWDDSLVVKNYGRNSENIHFSNIQIWTDFAQSMEIGYETNKGKKKDATIKDITFEDITVIANYHKPVISIHNGDDATISSVTFKDIIVEEAQMGTGDANVMPYLIDLHIGQSSNWSTTKERGVIKDIRIENLTVLDGKFASSRIVGFDENHRVEDVTINNLQILGENIKDAESGRIGIDANTTSNIQIK